MRRLLLLTMAILVFSGGAAASETYSAKGLVLKVDKAHKSVYLSCEKIPNYMDAMAMSFSVRNPKELNGVTEGAMIEFTLVVNESSSYIEGIHIHHYESIEQDPLGARRLKLLGGLADNSPAKHEIAIGEHVPDFTLIDQTNQKVSLSQFNGKVIAITFTYTHCALPNFCFRIANNFRQLQKRFASHLGNDLVFMTITFDPVHDTPDVMAKYGKTWNADPRGWKLLTGPKSDVEALCDKFGISHWADEGLMTHALHTILIDRHGNLVSDLEGNEFTADQLGDLVQTTLSR